MHKELLKHFGLIILCLGAPVVFLCFGKSLWGTVKETWKPSANSANCSPILYLTSHQSSLTSLPDPQALCKQALAGDHKPKRGKRAPSVYFFGTLKDQLMVNGRDDILESQWLLSRTPTLFLVAGQFCLSSKFLVEGSNVNEYNYLPIMRQIQHGEGEQGFAFLSQCTLCMHLFCLHISLRVC